MAGRAAAAQAEEARVAEARAEEGRASRSSRAPALALASGTTSRTTGLFRVMPSMSLLLFHTMLG